MIPHCWSSEATTLKLEIPGLQLLESSTPPLILRVQQLSHNGAYPHPQRSLLEQITISEYISPKNGSKLCFECQNIPMPRNCQPNTPDFTIQRSRGPSEGCKCKGGVFGSKLVLFWGPSCHEKVLMRYRDMVTLTPT